jgi:ribulose-phosphate 3-epimerase
LTLIAPSILSADFGRLAEDVRTVEEAGADWIHVDVMDGRFVPNITIGPLVCDAVNKATNLPVDVHLMIESPDSYLEDFVRAGADRITVHQETCPHLHRTLERIRELGASPGVALNPSTPVSTLEDVVPYLDMILVMTVNPGFGGQSFIPTSPAKIGAAWKLLGAMGREEVLIQVDGGIGSKTAALAVQGGAGVLVAGSAVFGHAAGAGEGVRALKAAIPD